MPINERFKFTQELARRSGINSIDLKEWEALLKYTQGNPLTLKVVVAQAIKDDLRTKKEISSFIAALQTGETDINDPDSEDRTKSLSASLSYGFSNNFCDSELKKLALLCLFKGFVNITVLCIMGNPKEFMGTSTEDWGLSCISDITMLSGIELLDKVAEIGLLTKVGDYQYVIHPAVSWYLKSLFKQYYRSSFNNLQNSVEYSFSMSMACLAAINCESYGAGNVNSIEVFQLEESNLLYTKYLSEKNCWWSALFPVMEGLRLLYSYQGDYIT
jgi:hypothetical protein